MKIDNGEAGIVTVLVAGASGKTGRLLVEQLLALGHTVRVIVRASHRFPKAVLDHPNITVVETSILDLSDEQMAELVKGCDAVVSCLGHDHEFPRHLRRTQEALRGRNTTFVKCDRREPSDFANEVHFDEYGCCP